MKKIISGVLTAVSLVVGFTVATAAFAYGSSNQGKVNNNQEKIMLYSDSAMTDEVKHEKFDYDINTDGKTFGSGFDAMYIEDMHDLFSVVGDNGKIGFVYTDEFLGDSPSSPEEAVKIQESIDNGTYSPKVFNVYESDGKTVIDTFTEKIR